MKDKNFRAAAEAARARREPFVFFDTDEVDADQLPLPYLGAEVPEGWERVGQLLYQGRIRHLIKLLVNGSPTTYGFAIVEASPAQSMVGVFRKIGNQDRQEPSVDFLDPDDDPRQPLYAA